MNKVGVIGIETVRAYTRDRIFHAALVFAILILSFAAMLSTLTFDGRRKILLDFGFAAISLVGTAFALILGATGLRKEIDARTIYTLLAKPVRRWEYLIGKFLGLAAIVFLIHVFCAITLAIAVWLNQEALPQGYVSAIYLMILEATIILAAGILFSLSFSSLFLGAAITFAVFLIGRSAYGLHLLAERLNSGLGTAFETIYVIFPALQRFDIRDTVAYDRALPSGLLLTSSGYFLAYLAFLLGAAILVLRRRDLA